MVVGLGWIGGVGEVLYWVRLGLGEETSRCRNTERVKAAGVVIAPKACCWGSHQGQASAADCRPGEGHTFCSWSPR